MSFHRSQNVLRWFQCFVPDQKFIYILWQSLTFCARPKIYLHILAVTNLLCQTKRWFAFSEIGFCTGTNVFEETLMPCPFTGPKMFCADPIFLSQPKNLTAFSASSKTFTFCLVQKICDCHNAQYVNKTFWDLQIVKNWIESTV